MKKTFELLKPMLILGLGLGVIFGYDYIDEPSVTIAIIHNLAMIIWIVYCVVDSVKTVKGWFKKSK